MEREKNNITKVTLGNICCLMEGDHYQYFSMNDFKIIFEIPVLMLQKTAHHLVSTATPTLLSRFLSTSHSDGSAPLQRNMHQILK